MSDDHTEAEVAVPSHACDHAWGLAYKNPAAKRFVHVCDECGMKKHTDAGVETLGDHAPWIPKEHVASYEASLRAPKVESPFELHERLFKEALKARVGDKPAA